MNRTFCGLNSFVMNLLLYVIAQLKSSYLFHFFFTHMTLSTLLILEVCRTCVTYEARDGLTHRRLACSSVVEHCSTEAGIAQTKILKMSLFNRTLSLAHVILNRSCHNLPLGKQLTTSKFISTHFGKASNCVCHASSVVFFTVSICSNICVWS